MGRPALVYLDPERTSLSNDIDTQRADAQQLADRLGWDIISVYVEVDAAQRHQPEPLPAWAALIEALSDREAYGLIVPDLSATLTGIGALGRQMGLVVAFSAGGILDFRPRITDEAEL